MPFTSVLKAFRVLTSPGAGLYTDGQNGDAACDPRGALWVRPLSAPVSPDAVNSGSAMPNPFWFTTRFNPTTVQQGPVGYPGAIAGPISLQCLYAWCAQPAYLLAYDVFNLTIAPGTIPLFSWEVPLGGFKMEIPAPYGLNFPDGIVLAFSSTPGFLTGTPGAGPYGWFQGIYTTA